MPPSSTSQNTNESGINLGSSAVETENLDQSNSGSESNKSDLEQSDIEESESDLESNGPGCDRSLGNTDSSDESNGSGKQKPRKGFLVSAKPDRSNALPFALPEIPKRNSARLDKSSHKTQQQNASTTKEESDNLIISSRRETRDSTSTSEEDDPGNVTPRTEHLTTQQTNDIQKFDEELEKFVQELNSNGIQASSQDISLIRTKHLERLQLKKAPTQDKTQQKSGKKFQVQQGIVGTIFCCKTLVPTVTN